MGRENEGQHMKENDGVKKRAYESYLRWRTWMEKGE